MSAFFSMVWKFQVSSTVGRLGHDVTLSVRLYGWLRLPSNLGGGMSCWRRVANRSARGDGWPWGGGWPAVRKGGGGEPWRKGRSNRGGKKDGVANFEGVVNRGNT